MDHSTDSGCSAAPFHDRGTGPGSGSSFSDLRVVPLPSVVPAIHPKFLLGSPYDGADESNTYLIIYGFGVKPGMLLHFSRTPRPKNSRQFFPLLSAFSVQ